MKSGNRMTLAGMVLSVIMAGSSTGCGGGQPVQSITVAVSSASAIVDAGASTQVTAAVTNDATSKGVNWTVSCSVASCGSVSPTSTASGSPTTYTAPAKPPASDLKVTLTATALASSAQTASATITVPAVRVSVSPPSASVAINTTQQVTATVNNDLSNAGVHWALTQNGTACSPGCGSITPSTTLSGAPVTYTAPATVPSPGTAILTAASVTDTTKVASSTITVTPHPITISIAPPSATVLSGGTQRFTATVANDPSNGGVNWHITARLFCNNIFHCSPVTIVVPCSTCGSVSPTSTASGAQMTYTAPGHLTPPTEAGYHFSGTLLIVATSATNFSASGSAGINVLPISVSVSPTSASVALSATQQFTATATNDATSGGVTWTLSQNGTACSPSCGTISPATAASGAVVTYTAPATAPASPVVTVRATSVEDSTSSASATIAVTTSTGALLGCSTGSGNESLLKGQYAFLMQGFDKQGGLTIGGSFAADGSGKVTGGEEDIVFGGEYYSTFAAGSAYAVGSDHRGCLLLTNTNGKPALFQFALGSVNASSIATAGHIIEFDDTNGTGTRAAGVLRLQDATSFSAAQFKGNYAYGVVGAGSYTGRAVMAGTFSSDGVSTIPTSNFDVDGGGALTTNASSTGSFTCCSANGRGALQISTFNPAPNLPINSIFFYMINSSDAFLVVFSDVWAAGGEAIGIPSGTNFSQASLSGASVLRETAQSASGPGVDIATVSTDGKAAMNINDNLNNAGTFTTSSTALNYRVASNARVTFTGGSSPPVIYLYGPNQGFLVGTDPDVTFGILEPQAAGPFSNASFSGAYTLGTENPSASTVTMESGVLTADGKGSASGTSDQSSLTGLMQNQTLNLTYSFPANGVGNVGSNTTAILISGNKLVFISNTSANPTITVVEK